MRCFVEVYTLENEIWVRHATLQEHTQTVSGLDWSVNDELVSVSHDRNVFVWTQCREPADPSCG